MQNQVQANSRGCGDPARYSPRLVCSIMASLLCCRSVRSSGFFQSAKRAPLRSVARAFWPLRRASFQTARHTSSSALVAPLHDVKRIHAQRCLAALPHPVGDPCGRINADQSDGHTTLFAQQIEERPQRGLVAATAAHTSQPSRSPVPARSDILRAPPGPRSGRRGSHSVARGVPPTTHRGTCHTR